MKNKDYLTVRQEELMNFLWKVNEPLTANEMAERLAEDGWNNVTLFKTVQSLTTDGYLEVVGLEKTVKTYQFPESVFSAFQEPSRLMHVNSLRLCQKTIIMHLY